MIPAPLYRNLDRVFASRLAVGVCVCVSVALLALAGAADAASRLYRPTFGECLDVCGAPPLAEVDRSDRSDRLVGCVCKP